MNTIKQARDLSAQRVRRLASALVLGAGAAAATVLQPGFRRRVVAAGAAAALAASSLLPVQPATAATEVIPTISFDYVQFAQVNDGCCPDTTIEVYGSLTAYTSAADKGAYADNLNYRNFGTWGQDPCEVAWDAYYGSSGPCARLVTNTSYGLSSLQLCSSNAYNTCVTNPDNPNKTYDVYRNSFARRLHAGETLTVSVNMMDYDWGSADDVVCKGSVKFGPYTDAQLLAGAWKTNSGVIHMPSNGNAECWVHFKTW